MNLSAVKGFLPIEDGAHAIKIISFGVTDNEKGGYLTIKGEHTVDGRPYVDTIFENQLQFIANGLATQFGGEYVGQDLPALLEHAIEVESITVWFRRNVVETGEVYLNKYYSAPVVKAVSTQPTTPVSTEPTREFTV